MKENIIKFTKTEREIIKLHLKGLSNKDIAQRLGCSIRTVYKALYKYRRALREGFSQEEILRSIGVVEKKDDNLNPTPQLITYSKSETSQALTANPQINYLPIPTIPIILPYTAQPLQSAAQLNGVLEKILQSLVKIESMLQKLETQISLMQQTLEAIQDRIPLSRQIPRITRKAEPKVEIRPLRQEYLPSFMVDNPWLEVLANITHQT